MGYVIPVVLRTALDFTELGSSLTGKEVVLAKGIDVTGGRTVDAALRIHSKDIGTANSYIRVIVRAEAPSTEDPATEYVYKPTTELIQFELTSTLPTGTLMLDKLIDSDPFGGFLRVIVIPYQAGTAGTTALKATISMDLVLRP